MRERVCNLKRIILMSVALCIFMYMGFSCKANEDFDSEPRQATKETETIPKSATPAPPTSAKDTPTPALTDEPLATLTDESIACEERIAEDSYPSMILGQAIPFQIYLPPCYDGNEQSYPVIYFMHGKPRQSADWIDLGIIDLVSQGIASGQWPETLLVIPSLPEPLFSQTDGGSGSYEEEFLEALVPYVDRHYRTRIGADYRALAGISRGAIWALEIGFRHPEIVNIIAALSPALSCNYASRPYDPFALAQDSDCLPDRILLLAGDMDWARSGTEKLSQILEQSGNHPHLMIVEGKHETALWKGTLETVVDFIVFTWQEPE